MNYAAPPFSVRTRAPRTRTPSCTSAATVARSCSSAPAATTACTNTASSALRRGPMPAGTPSSVGTATASVKSPKSDAHSVTGCAPVATTHSSRPQRDGGAGAPERILDAARQLLQKRRGQGVRVADVAAAAGVARQAVYLHYPTRAALLIATVRHADAVEGLERRLARVERARGSLDLLDAYIEFWGGYVPRIHGLARALLELHVTDSAAAAAWDDRMALVRDRCGFIVEALRRDGLLAPGWRPARAADLLGAMLSIPTWEALTIDRGWSEREYARWMKRAARGAFVVERPARGG